MADSKAGLRQVAPVVPASFRVLYCVITQFGMPWLELRDRLPDPDVEVIQFVPVKAWRVGKRGQLGSHRVIERNEVGGEYGRARG